MPLRRPQQLETPDATSLYPAVPVMRGGTYAASPLAARPRSPMRSAPGSAKAYSPAPVSLSGGAMASPHVHWADFAFVREVSNIFDRQMELEMVPHTPEVVANPFRRRTTKQFYLEGETPPATSASAGTLFTVAPMPMQTSHTAGHRTPTAANASTVMMGNFFAGMGSPVVERSISPKMHHHGAPSPAHGVQTRYVQTPSGTQRISTSSATVAHHNSAASPLQRVHASPHPQQHSGHQERQSSSGGNTTRLMTPKTTAYTTSTVSAYTPSAGVYTSSAPSSGRRNSLSGAYAPSSGHPYPRVAYG